MISNNNRTSIIDNKVIAILKSFVSMANSRQFRASGKQTVYQIDAEEYSLEKFFLFGQISSHITKLLYLVLTAKSKFTSLPKHLSEYLLTTSLETVALLLQERIIAESEYLIILEKIQVNRKSFRIIANPYNILLQ